MAATAHAMTGFAAAFGNGRGSLPARSLPEAVARLRDAHARYRHGFDHPDAIGPARFLTTCTEMVEALRSIDRLLKAEGGLGPRHVQAGLLERTSSAAAEFRIPVLVWDVEVASAWFDVGEFQRREPDGTVSVVSRDGWELMFDNSLIFADDADGELARVPLLTLADAPARLWPPERDEKARWMTSTDEALGIVRERAAAETLRRVRRRIADGPFDLLDDEDLSELGLLGKPPGRV